MDPDRDERLRAATVGEPTIHGRPIELVDHDPAWVARFEQEARRIAAVLGDRARAIEHVGSTAVPGLAAKPIVDILLVVVDPAEEASYVPPLETLGYVLRIREPDWFEHRMFVGPKADVHLHVLPDGCPEIDRMLRFRDRLRSDQADRERYERAKRDLARREWRYVQDYADAKTAVIEEIIARS